MNSIKQIPAGGRGKREPTASTLPAWSPTAVLYGLHTAYLRKWLLFDQITKAHNMKTSEADKTITHNHQSNNQTANSKSSKTRAVFTVLMGRGAFRVIWPLAKVR